MTIRIGYREGIAEIHADRRLQDLDAQALPVGNDRVDRRLVRLGESDFSAAGRQGRWRAWKSTRGHPTG